MKLTTPLVDIAHLRVIEAWLDSLALLGGPGEFAGEVAGHLQETIDCVACTSQANVRTGTRACCDD
jgi:hypothetical protein